MILILRTFKYNLIPTLISASMGFTKVQCRFNNMPYKNFEGLQSFFNNFYFTYFPII